MELLKAGPRHFSAQGRTGNCHLPPKVSLYRTHLRQKVLETFPSHLIVQYKYNNNFNTLIANIFLLLHDTLNLQLEVAASLFPLMVASRLIYFAEEMLLAGHQNGEKLPI